MLLLLKIMIQRKMNLKQQQHERAICKNDCKNESGLDGTLQELAGEPEWAAHLCRATPVRAAQPGRAGAGNPIGDRDAIRHASGEEDWPLPAEKDEKKTGRWYTEEESEEFFEH